MVIRRQSPRSVRASPVLRRNLAIYRLRLVLRRHLSDSLAAD